MSRTPEKIEFLPGRYAELHTLDNSIENINDLKKNTTKLINTPENPLYDRKRQCLSGIEEEWKRRSSNIKSLKQVPFSVPVILCNWKGLHKDVLDRLENVYQVVDENTTSMYPSALSYFMDVRTRTDLDIIPYSTYLYFGDLYNKKKAIQRHWNHRADMRSFKTLDDKYNNMDKKSSTESSLEIALYNFITSRHKGDHLPVFYNLNIEDTNPQVQILFKRKNITCI